MNGTRSNGWRERPGARESTIEMAQSDSRTRFVEVAADTVPRCVCGEGRQLTLVHVYSSPPSGETPFDLAGKRYRRELRRCERCSHIILTGTRLAEEHYRGSYMKQTYGAGASIDGLEAIRRGFARIQSLRAGESDNAVRVQRVDGFAKRRFGSTSARQRLLDVGSGLGVFIDGIRRLGWSCVGVDPDPNACAHLCELGAEAFCAMFEEYEPTATFDVVSLNKVLEHVREPALFLSRAHCALDPDGVVYVEVPDGEAALADGPAREEFFIEHLHAFSASSLCLVLRDAGFMVLECQRMREPSGKYTLAAFACADSASMSRYSRVSRRCDGAD